MTDLDRRSFVALLAAAGALVAVRDVPVSGQTDESYRLLVVGDSLIWGQGLEEKRTRSTHTWLSGFAEMSLGAAAVSTSL